MRGPARIAALAGVIAAAACTSLLGDFTQGPGQPDATAPRDASSEAPPGDASNDGEAGSGQLSCTTWRWPQPLVIEDLAMAPSRLFTERFVAFPGDTDQVRIVAAKDGSPAFSVYTVTKTTQQVQQLDAPVFDGGSSLPFVSVIHHVPAATGGTTAVVVGQRSPSGATSYSVTTLDDLKLPAAGPLPQPFTLLSPVSSAQVLDDLSVLPFSTTDIFAAVSLGTGNPLTYTLGVARVSPTAPSSPATLATIATSPNAGDFASMRMLHTNGNVYIYDMNDLSTPGCSGWTVPDTAMVATPPTKQPVALSTAVGVVGLNPNAGLSPPGSTAAADVLMLEQDFSNQFTSGYKYYAGTVAVGALSTWTTNDLSKLARATSPFAAPVFNESPINNVVFWWSDNAMMLGPGLRNGVTDAGPGPGLNLLWVNSLGAIRADQTGANEILNDRANFFLAHAVPARLAPTSAAWDVVWVETITNAAGAAHHVMRMNELNCQ